MWQSLALKLLGLFSYQTCGQISLFFLWWNWGNSLICWHTHVPKTLFIQLDEFFCPKQPTGQGCRDMNIRNLTGKPINFFRKCRSRSIFLIYPNAFSPFWKTTFCAQMHPKMPAPRSSLDFFSPTRSSGGAGKRIVTRIRMGFRARWDAERHSCHLWLRATVRGGVGPVLCAEMRQA